MMDNVAAWDREHQRREWGTWPDSHLVRFALRTWPDRAKRRHVRVLDVGCGAGAQTMFLAQEGFIVTGIDTSGAAIERCCERAWNMDRPPVIDRPSFAVCPAWAITSTDNHFDLAVDVCCLQHLDDKQFARSVNEIARVVKRGGRLFSMHMASNSWSGVSVVGEVYPRSSSEILAEFAPHFDVDIFHEHHERRHPDGAAPHVAISHWLTEGRRR